MSRIRFAMLAAAISRIMESKGFIRQEARMPERQSALNLLIDFASQLPGLAAFDK